MPQVRRAVNHCRNIFCFHQIWPLRLCQDDQREDRFAKGAARRFFCIINPLFGLEYILWASPIMAAVVLFIRLFRTLQLQFPENG